MRPEILGIFVPIVFLVGLFTVIALNIIFKYKAKNLIANRVESIEEWYKTEAKTKIIKAEARAVRKHGVGLRICGLVIGIGLGVALGCVIIACNGASNDAIATFMIISLAMIFGGAGMIGAYFLERKLDDRKQEK